MFHKRQAPGRDIHKHLSLSASSQPAVIPYLQHTSNPQSAPAPSPLQIQGSSSQCDVESTAPFAHLSRFLPPPHFRPPSPAVQETTSLFALLWRARMTRHAHAASHVPSDTPGEHDTPTPVLVRPRGRAPTSESGVREHKPHSRCSSRTTRTRTKMKHTQMTTIADWFGRIRLPSAALEEEPEVPVLKVAYLSKLSARFGRFLPNYPDFLGLFGLFG